MTPSPVATARNCAGPACVSSDAVTNEATADLLPDPGSAFIAPGDLGAAIAVLAVQNGVAERWAAREARQADEAQAQTEEAAEVSALRKEALSLRTQAGVDVCITAIGVAGGGATGALVAKVGTSFVDGWLGADQKGDEATAKGCEAAGADARSAADDAHDNLSAADAFIKAAIDFYQEYVVTRGQTANAAARRG
jgi:hypothetical protein